LYVMSGETGVCPVTSEKEELVLIGIGAHCSGCGTMFIADSHEDDLVGQCIEQFRRHVK
jgi:hypothetical protein